MVARLDGCHRLLEQKLQNKLFGLGSIKTDKEFAMQRFGLIAITAALLVVSPYAAAQSENLSGALWVAEGLDCHIILIRFNNDSPDGVNGTAHADFSYDDETDTAKWHLSGNNLSIKFDHYNDTFIGTMSGDTMNVAHSWQEDGKPAPMTENCVLKIDNYRYNPN